jgi:hypothetical protein
MYDQLAPLAHDDASNNYALAWYIAALSEAWQDVDDVARDTDAGPGWSSLLDLNRCPVEALPWLAQFVGVKLVTGSTDAAMRARIASTDGWKRGTPAALIGAVTPLLTGTKTVIFRERNGGDPYALLVHTKTSETPDSAAVLAALMKQKPAGIILTYTVISGNDYQTLLTDTPLYSNVFSTYATYTGVVDDVPGT